MVAGVFLVGGLLGGVVGSAAGGGSAATGSSNNGSAPAAPQKGPVLEGRAKLSSLHEADGSNSGKDALNGNGQTHPFKG